MKKKSLLISTICILISLILFSVPIYSYADDDETDNEFLAEAEARKNLPVESNNWQDWPTGPLIGAEAAILMDADTGEILYAKNIDERLFPASTTKLMTCLVAIENASLDDLITVNQSAIDANEWDGSNMGLVAGEKLTLDELIQGMLIKSANEACNAVGEYIAGSMDAYVQMMNDKAAELGLENTHFVTTNGLQDDNHYTSAYDLAIIAREFFSYDILCKYSSKTGAILEANENHEEHEIYSKNKLFENREYEYEYLVGSKTGYTGAARQTLVSCAEKDGVRLICVIMKEESPYQFEDTIALFEYGFNNFTKVNVTTNETKYNITHSDFFIGENDPVIYIDPEASFLIPANASFEELTGTISYANPIAPYFGSIDYYYNDAYVGSAGIAFKEEVVAYDSFSSISPAEAAQNQKKSNHILINIKKIFIVLLILVGVFVLFLFSTSILKRFHFSDKNLISGGPSFKGHLKSRRDIKKGLKKRRRNLSSKKTSKNDNSYHPPKPKNRDNFNFKDFDL